MFLCVGARRAALCRLPGCLVPGPHAVHEADAIPGDAAGDRELLPLPSLCCYAILFCIISYHTLHTVWARPRGGDPFDNQVVMCLRPHDFMIQTCWEICGMSRPNGLPFKLSQDSQLSAARRPVGTSIVRHLVRDLDPPPVTLMNPPFPGD